MKRVWKMVCALLMIFSFIVIPASTAQAKRYSENGTWKKVIKESTWYFDVNDYTSREPGSKYYGMVYIFKGKSNLDNYKDTVRAEYAKVGTNKFKIKYSGGVITFKVNKKTITLKQVRGTVNGTKLNGKFKLVRRHYS